MSLLPSGFPVNGETVSALPLAPPRRKKLDELLNRYTAGKMTEQEYNAARDKILSGGK